MKIPQHFSDDAPLILVSCRMFQVLQQKMSSRCGSDLTCWTHSLDRPFCLRATRPPKPRHTLCASRGNSLISLKMHPQLSNCRHQASCPSPIQQLGICKITPLHRSSDRTLFHTQTVHCSTKFVQRDLGLAHHCQVGLAWSESGLGSGLGSLVLRGRFVASVSKASPPFLAQFVSCILRNLLSSHNKCNQVLCRKTHACVAFGTFIVIALLSTHHEGVPMKMFTRCQEWSSGIPRNTNTEVQEVVVPGLFPSKSLQNCTCQGFLESATRIHRFSGQLFYIHRSSRLASPASWFRNALLPNSPAPCRTP